MQPHNPESHATHSHYQHYQHEPIPTWAKFIFKLDTTSKHKNKPRRLRRWLGSAPQKIKVSLANKRREMSTPVSIEKLDNRPPLAVVEIILPNGTIRMTNNKGNRGFPLPHATRAAKKSVGQLFTNIEKRTKEIQQAIQEHYFPPNPHLLSMYKKSQLTSL